MKKIPIILLCFFLISPVYADGPPGPTPTPGGPGGGHGLPIPDIPSIDALKAKYGVPEESESHQRINFFWELDNWLNLLEASRIAAWFSVNRTWSVWLLITILMIVLIAIRFVVRNVYGAGAAGIQSFRDRGGD